MDEELKNSLAEWSDNAEVVEFYETWGGKEPLLRVFDILNSKYPDWNLECEIGSWAVDFLQDVLTEVEDEWQEMSPQELQKSLEETIDELYEDCVEGHQFARLNNVRLSLPEGSNENAELEKSDEEIGFPVLE